MEILHNVSLRPSNSFNLEVYADKLVEINNVEDLEHMNPIPEPFFVLGGGSNVLFTQNFKWLILKNQIKGVEIVHENEEEVFVTVGGGENWSDFVSYCISKNWGGLENLSLIPGTVGAAPIQNIGAYGVEQEYCFYSLKAFHFKTGKIKTFTKADCLFGYRESVFKNALKSQFFIVDVTYRFLKHPILHVSYGAIKKQLGEMGVQIPSIQSISQAVIEIRKSKLPDPKELGNAGSFFKNPIVPASLFLNLLSKFPEMPHYQQSEAGIKLAAGWLIEQCGWKGYRKSDVGCYSLQALVIVNYGNAKGAEIFDFSELIINSVFDKFGVKLEREENFL
jgi:UDP-N-acetylmuramate dehydrogenase